MGSQTNLPSMVRARSESGCIKRYNREHSTLALRVTRHPVASALCRAFARPIVSTSANPQGLPAATTGDKVQSYFGPGIDFQTEGSVGDSSNASEIRDLVSGQIVRPG